MQRCLFLIICALFSINTVGQQSDVITNELSIWYEGENQETLKMKSLITLNRGDLKRVKLDFHPHQIQSVKLREGRLKASIGYSHENDRIVLNLEEHSAKVVQLEFNYSIFVKDPYYKNHINQKEIPLGLNTQNIFMGRNLGQSGAFFPSLKNDDFIYTANITLSAKVNSGTFGELEYEVEHGNGLKSQFWRAKETLTAENFYLVIGDFKQFDAEDFEDDYDLEQVDMSEFLAAEERLRLENILNYLQKRTGITFDDDYMLKLDSVSKASDVKLWVKPQLLEVPISPTLFKKYIILCLEASGGDSLKAVFLHLDYLTQIQGKTWRDKLIREQWSKFENFTDPSAIDNYALKAYSFLWLNSYDKEAYKNFVDGNWEGESSPYWNYTKQLWKQNVPPSIQIKYNYRDGYEWLYLTQDTSIVDLYAVPFEMTIYSKDTVLKYKGISNDTLVTDTFKFPQQGSPQAVSVSFGEHFTGRVKMPRSDIHDLYLFSNAPTSQERQAALYRLFETNNPNLFSTVLGIAMDSKEAEVRLEALKHSHELNVPAQMKLKGTLIKLSREDPDENVKEHAKLLVQKYYNNK